MKVRYALIVFAVLGGIAVWSYLYLRPAEETGFVYVSGRIEGDEVDVGIKVAGRIKELRVKEGETVKKDQVVATLDARDLKARLSQAVAAKKSANAHALAAKAELAVYKKRLKAAETGRTYLAKQVEADLKVAEANLEKNEADLNRFKTLLEENVIPLEKFEKIKEAYRISLARYKLAQKGWVRVKAKNEQIDSLREAVSAKERVYQSALSAVDQAEAAISEIKSYLEDTIVKAPCNGTVMVKMVEPGEVVPAGAPLVTVIELDKLYLKGYVPETKIGKIRLNAPAYIVLDAFGEERFPAAVGYISQYAEFTPKEVQTKEERVKQVFAVKLYLKENPKHLLKPGMPGDGYIKIETP
ncbi:MAG: hypothetical protein DRH43_03720 [Deltaproteobacteria bacterium]|nr:MAG: hypothetical protein DRH43_03720 [Deltaproteobacteria bacterium]